MKLDRFIITYQGNKYLETRKHLINDVNINNYDIICEPFCGIFGFSRAMFEKYNDFKGKIYLNDLNTSLINFLKKLKTEPKKFVNDLSNELDNINDDREIKKSSDDIKFVSSRSMGLYNKHRGMTKIKNYLEKLNDYSFFFKHVELFNLPADKFIEQLPKDKKILIYLDPPYFNSANMSYTYYDNNNKKKDYPDGTDIYVDIYNLFKNNKTYDILFLMNNLAFFNMMFNEYKLKEYEGTYQNQKNKKKHVIFYKSNIN